MTTGTKEMAQHLFLEGLVPSTYMAFIHNSSSWDLASEGSSDFHMYHAHMQKYT